MSQAVRTRRHAWPNVLEREWMMATAGVFISYAFPSRTSSQSLCSTRSVSEHCD
eukprot:gene8371-7197_t